jgi:Na+-driven multidrug efflux pump
MGGVGQFIIATASWVILMKIMNQFGEQVVAGYTIAIRLFMFTLLPSWGMSNAAATLVGQNLGAKQPDRAEYSVMKTAMVNSMLMLFFAVVFLSSGEYFIRLFTDELAVVAAGELAIKTISYGYLFYGLGMIMPQAFNGAGDTTTPTWINFISYWIIQIPLAYFLAINLELNETGVFWAIVTAETTMALMSFMLFKRGKWKLMEV